MNEQIIGYGVMALIWGVGLILAFKTYVEEYASQQFRDMVVERLIGFVGSVLVVIIAIIGAIVAASIIGYTSTNQKILLILIAIAARLYMISTRQ
jgi:hypothetical protein